MGICHLIVPVRVYENYSYGLDHVTYWDQIISDKVHMNNCQNDSVWFIEMNEVIS